jgi:tetratricopeptide (TPR) repeat protein
MIAAHCAEWNANRKENMKKRPAKSQHDSDPEQPGQVPMAFATESMLRDLQRTIEEKKFGSIEELNDYLASVSASGVPPEDRPTKPPSPRDEAQELAWQAADAETEEQTRALVQQALAKDPDCVDALVGLAALEARTPKEAIRALERAVQAGERSLGAEFFAGNKGHFWLIIETRPYMRARAELAALHRSEGHTRKAIDHYEALLELNPNDNQGVRYPLVGCYLAANELGKARKLFQQYDEESATFAWARVLERYLAHDASGARSALAKARKVNRFVELYLSSVKSLPDDMPDSYAPGSEEEAVLCVVDVLPAWGRHQKAIFWLLDRLHGSVRPGRG